MIETHTYRSICLSNTISHFYIYRKLPFNLKSNYYALYYFTLIWSRFKKKFKVGMNDNQLRDGKSKNKCLIHLLKESRHTIRHTYTEKVDQRTQVPNQSQTGISFCSWEGATKTRLNQRCTFTKCEIISKGAKFWIPLFSEKRYLEAIRTDFVLSSLFFSHAWTWEQK